MCDLGLSKETNQRPHTPRVQNRYYRAPEVLLGLNYDEKIDIWSLGIMTSKLIFQKSVFLFGPEDDNAKILKEIYKICGSPSE